MRFYNREDEIAELKRICALSFSRNSRMTVVTGRRRIGKTSLIKKAFSDSEAPMLYFFAAVDEYAGYDSPVHLGIGEWPIGSVIVKYTKSINM